jgi:hypothetical protein
MATNKQSGGRGDNAQDLRRQLDEARQDPSRAGEVADLEQRVQAAEQGQQGNTGGSQQ